jgi:hypothetical protein
MLEVRRSRGSGKTIPVFKLSAQMVDLSLQHDQRDSLLTDSPSHFPKESQCYPLQTKVELINASSASTTQEEAIKPAQLDFKTAAQSGLERASRRILRMSISRIRDHGVRLHGSHLWTSIGIVALTLLAVAAVYGLRGHHPDSDKSSQISRAVQQRQEPLAPATSIASEKANNDAHAVSARKSKSRRRRDDYVAKDTYVHYGKDGKPSR